MLKKILVVLAVLISCGTAFGAHPLITDDTATQGKGKFQLEVNSEFTSDRETEEGIVTKETSREIPTVLAYGLMDNVDIVLGLPYQWHKVKVDGIADAEDPAAKADGISDMSLEVKWRFYEKEGLSLGLKPGISLPTGDEKKGLGSGRTAYSLFFITSNEIEPWAFHLSLGYIRNENKADERKNLWHASLASEVEVIKNLKTVANIGIELNSDKTSSTHPAFILGGLIYSISNSIAVDIGLKGGLNKPAPDLTFLAGIAWRF